MGNLCNDSSLFSLPDAWKFAPVFCADADSSFDVQRGPHTGGENQADIPLQQTEEQPGSIGPLAAIHADGRRGWGGLGAWSCPLKLIR